MNKENKNGKRLSEEKLDKISGGAKFQPVTRDTMNGLGVGYNTNVDIGGVGYNDITPKSYTGKKVTSPLSKANPKMNFNH